MLTFHQFLDKIFKKQISFSIFFRIWLTFAVLIIVACSFALYYTQKTLRPSAKRVVEDDLADTARLLSALVADDIAQMGDDFGHKMSNRLSQAFDDGSQVLFWYDQKNKSQFHIYITNDVGKVIYDSCHKDVGADFSRWNDVRLTLQGKYGARSSNRLGHCKDYQPRDKSGKDAYYGVMYVASAIVKDGKILGVVSVGKPTPTLLPYIKKSQEEVIKIILTIMISALALSILMAWWLRHSIAMVNLYTKNLAQQMPPHFYLGKELNELTHNIHDMKNIIENKAYVTEYVHTLTHELKSPLTAIRASGELLAWDLTDEERQRFSAIITEQADKLTVLVNQLLTLAKIEQPSFKLNQTSCNIGQIISSQIAQLSALCTKLHKNIDYIPQDVYIMADEFWLAQAFQNILDNAIYYGLSSVFVQVIQSRKQTKIIVINDSQKLPEYVGERAFERYFSLPNIHQKKGTGLGLTLVKQVAQLHQASVEFMQVSANELKNQYPDCVLIADYFVVVTLTFNN